MSPHPDSTVVDPQSGSALSANSDDAAAMLVGAVKRYGGGQSARRCRVAVTLPRSNSRRCRPRTYGRSSHPCAGHCVVSVATHYADKVGVIPGHTGIFERHAGGS